MTETHNTSKQGAAVLNRIRNLNPFIQGSLSISKKRCGNASCRCATEGPLHEFALLTWKQSGKTRSLYVPIELREEIRKCTEEAKLLKRLIAQMSKFQREFLLGSKKKRTKKKS